MEDTHEVIVPNDVRLEIETIVAYIRQVSPQNAVLVGDRLHDAIDSLGFMPERFKRVGHSRRRGVAVRAMVVRPFIIYYSVEGQLVHILHVRHGARRQPRRFD